MKRLLCIALAAALAVSFGGCSPKGGSGGEYTFNVFTMRVTPDPNSSIMQELQQKLGAQIRVTAVPDADYITQLNLRITSGDIPDIYGSNPDSKTTLKAAAALTIDQVKENCPEIYQDFLNNCETAGYNPEKILERWTVDGELKAFHNGSKQTGPYSIVIRTDILKDIGVDIPKTIGDWDKTFAAFKKKYPDKYPVTAMSGGAIGAFYMWLCAYRVVRTHWVLHTEGPDGPYLGYPEFEPGFREALIKFNEWYKKGYVNPELATMYTDTNIWQSEFINGNTFVTQYLALGQQSWIYPPFGNADSVIAKCAAVNPGATFEVCPFPVVDGSNEKPFVNVGSAFNGYAASFGAQLGKNPDKLNFGMKMWATLFSDPEINFLMRYGREGETYDMVNGAPVVRAAYSTFDDRGKMGFGWPFNGMFNVGPRIQEKNDSEFSRNLREEYFYKPGAVYGKDNIEFSNYPRVTGPLIDAEGNDLTALDKSYETEMDAMFFNVISGNKTIEDFDAFLVRWKAGNGDKMVKLANELYLEQWLD
jgi:ABC-type glycerol-3-phosphate transport system substrate-binding protein